MDEPQPMTDVDTLLYMRDLLATGWCRGHQALDGDGRPVKPTSPEAESWCLIGAACATGPEHLTALKWIQKALGLPAIEPTVLEFNDQVAQGQEEVLNLVDKAIRLAKEAA